MKHWTFSDYSLCVSTNRVLLQRIFYSLALFSLGLNFRYHILISQIGPNPLLNQDVDPVYLMFMALGIPQFISGWPAPYFDTLLILSCTASIFRTRQRVFPVLFLILYFIYFIVYNMLSGHHYIHIGVMIMAFPFIFSKASRFVTAFSLCRFILCFMMFSAACWKIIRGNLWHVDQTNMLLITTYLENLVTNNNSVRINIVKWLVHHKYAAHSIWISLIAIEGVFILGFLGLKWDKLLLTAYLLFFVGGWFIFENYIFDNLFFLLTLTPVLKIISRLNQFRFREMPDNSKPATTS
ncbi:MAG TPA: hypothetical protein VK616_01555 [Flavitalea sp.]|nr:hypothetical protein [Flavitalea sp.]